MPTNLTPKSQTSALVLTATGSATEVEGALAYGIYTGSAPFISGAVDQVAYVYNKLGGNILDIEITTQNVYNAYEEACLEYSYLINTHQAKNVLSDLLGNTTGSFTEDGEFSSYTPEYTFILSHDSEIYIAYCIFYLCGGGYINMLNLVNCS